LPPPVSQADEALSMANADAADQTVGEVAPPASEEDLPSGGAAEEIKEIRRTFVPAPEPKPQAYCTYKVVAGRLEVVDNALAPFEAEEIMEESRKMGVRVAVSCLAV